jgi:uncharacterized protein YjiS (DUF1127 family)
MTTIMIGSGPRPAARRRGRRPWPAWPAAAVWRLLGWIARARRNRRDMRTLAALDERQLADIGLCRLDVDRQLPRGSRGVTWEIW